MNKKYPNLTVELYVNQTQVLIDSDVYFCHAGASSIYEAIWFTTPVVLIPMGLDQPENAEVAEKINIGKVFEYKCSRD